MCVCVNPDTNKCTSMYVVDVAVASASVGVLVPLHMPVHVPTSTLPPPDVCVHILGLTMHILLDRVFWSGCVHGGCLATAADALLGDFAVLVHNGLTMTRSITVCFRRFVELGSVVCFNVSPLIPEKGQSSNSPHAPEANLRPGDLAFHVSFHQTGSASPSGGPDSKSLLVEAHAVFSRPRQHYLPHVPLPPRTELAHAQPLGEVDGGANVPSARDEGIRVAFATRSFRNLVLQMPSTTTCWEAALRKVAVPSSRDGCV